MPTPDAPNTENEQAAATEATPAAAAPPAEAPQPQAQPPQAAAPAQLTDIESDPLLRAELEKRKAEEIAKIRAEAEESRKTERAALEAKLRQEAAEKAAADEAEAARVAQLTEAEQLQAQIDAMAKQDAERERAKIEADAKAKAAEERLDFVRAVVNSGARLASTDEGLEDLAMSKAQALVAGGKTMAEAIAALAEDKSSSFMFAQPEAPASKASTAAGSSAQRGAAVEIRPASAPKEFNAFAAKGDEFASYMATGGWQQHVHRTSQQDAN